jgi:TM2 domain-containing membrane protein YozV
MDMDDQTSQTTPPTSTSTQPSGSQPYRRNYFIALLLSIFVGEFGIDRFYMGKIGTGLLKLVTLGGLGIWWIIDIVLVATGNMRDKNGNTMVRRFDIPGDN